jgi:hypothetical protein
VSNPLKNGEEKEFIASDQVAFYYSDEEGTRKVNNPSC